MPIDVDALRRDHPPSAVVGRYIKLEADGHEFKACCPFHKEKTPSFYVIDDKQLIHCFGCGFSGDVIDFTMRYEDVGFKDACERLGAQPGEMRAVQTERVAPESSLEPVQAEDEDLPRKGEKVTLWNPKRLSWPTWRPSMVFPYRDDIGRVIGAVLRVEMDGGHKITPQIRLSQFKVPVTDKDGVIHDAGTVTWALWSFDRPRPLYGLENLGADGEVMVLEGEKKADLARKLGFEAVAWPGGANGHPHVDWTPLKGRALLLWGDADQEGEHAMLGRTDEQGRRKPGVAELATAAGAGAIRYLPWDKDRPKGWDICDIPKVRREKVAKYIAARAVPWIPQAPFSGPPGAGPSTPSPDASGASTSAKRQPAAACHENQGNAPTNDRPVDTDRDPASGEDPDEIARQVLSEETHDGEQESQARQAEEGGASSGDPGERDRGDSGLLPEMSGGTGQKTVDNRPINGHAVPSDKEPFRILGHNRGTYYYLPAGTEQVVELTPSQHSQSNLISLAPLQYWEDHFDGANSRQKFDIGCAQNALMRRAEEIGIFVPDRLRGRGAWLDDGRPVMHLGDTVFIDEEEYAPAKVPSSYIYEAAPALHVKRADPVTNQSAQHLVTICNKLTWEHKLSGNLLAGWCVVAPVCGAMNHRPHIWITGPSTSGKTTAINQIVNRVVGPFAIKRDGTTTEANLRQSLFHDARPVIIDEAESDDKVAATRMRNVLELSRIATDGGTIGKGGKDGNPIQYTVRAAFCYSSINVAIANYADESRISRLVLMKNNSIHKEQHFTELNALISKHLTDDYAAKMFARSVRYLPILLNNARVFTDACSSVMGSRRAGNQIGTLLAGLYLCHSSNPIGFEKAVEWVKERQWDTHAALDAMKDESRMLSVIALMRRSMTTARGLRSVTIGELIEISAYGKEVEGVGSDEARRELGRIGIKTDNTDKGYVFIVANKSPELSRLLEGKPWATDWVRPLRSLGGVPTDTEYFSQGLVQRGTRLPVTVLSEG